MARRSRYPARQKKDSDKRSGLEDQIAEQLDKLKVDYEYETVVLPYVPPQKVRRYTPDFILPNGIVVEAKGRFDTADRQKMAHIIAAYPDLDIRMVFSNPNNRISKVSKTTYAVWCDGKGIPWAKGYIPEAWLKEPPNPRSLRVISELNTKKGKK